MPPRVRRPIPLHIAGLAVWRLLVGPADAAEPGPWAPVPLRSIATFEATHPLGNFSGRAEELSGEVRVDPADLAQGVRGAVSVGVSALRTGIQGRDRDMVRALDGERHPEIRYTIESADASFGSLSDRADVTLALRGTISIRGVDRPLVFSARARLREARIWVRGESSLRLTDFGIAPPRRLLLAVGNEVEIRFDVLLQRAPP